MTDDLPERRRAEVRGIMARTGLKSSQLAKRAGLAPSTVTRFLRGDVDHTLSDRTLDRIRQVGEEAAQAATDTGFAQRLKAARTQAELTQSGLARLVGITPSAVQFMERGETKRSRHTGALARALGVDALWLETGAEPDPVKPEPPAAEPPPRDDALLAAITVLSNRILELTAELRASRQPLPVTRAIVRRLPLPAIGSLSA